MTPGEALQQLVREGMAGRATGAQVVEALLATELVVPSGAPVGPNFAGFVPVLYDRDGTQMLAVFTTFDRVGQVATLARYALTIVGRELLRIMPPGAGLVLDPGHSEGFELLPDAIARLRATPEA